MVLQERKERVTRLLATCHRVTFLHRSAQVGLARGFVLVDALPPGLPGGKVVLGIREFHAAMSSSEHAQFALQMGCPLAKPVDVGLAGLSQFRVEHN